MNTAPPACWVCDDTQHLCRCPKFGPEGDFPTTMTEVGEQFTLPIYP